jgi:hypothetical protein
MIASDHRLRFIGLFRRSLCPECAGASEDSSKNLLNANQKHGDSSFFSLGIRSSRLFGEPYRSIQFGYFGLHPFCNGLSGKIRLLFRKG